MFDKEFSFVGKHADYVRALTNNPFAEDGKQRGIFQRNVDVYMIAPLVGILYNRKSNQDNSSSKYTTKIFSDQFVSRTEELNFILSTIILNDRDIADNEPKIENAFKNLYDDKHKEIFYRKFNEYLLGGVELLYEKIIFGTKSFDDILSNFNIFIEDFATIYATSTYQKQSIFDQEELEVK